MSSPPPLPLGCELRGYLVELMLLPTAVAAFRGTINNARLVQDEVQSFRMLISDAIIEETVRYTNSHIANVQSKY
jgi:hypothetical protein